jgi:hypothetical protein
MKCLLHSNVYGGCFRLGDSSASNDTICGGKHTASVFIDRSDKFTVGNVIQSTEDSRPNPREAHNDRSSSICHHDHLSQQTDAVKARHKVCRPPTEEGTSFLRPVTDDLSLETPGMFSIPSEYDQIQYGQIGPSIETGSRSATCTFVCTHT